MKKDRSQISCTLCQHHISGPYLIAVNQPVRAGLKPNGPIAPNWAPHPILQTLVQVDWEPGLTDIVPNWAPRRTTLVQVDWEPGPTEIVPNWAPHLINVALQPIIAGVLLTIHSSIDSLIHQLIYSTMRIITSYLVMVVLSNGYNTEKKPLPGLLFLTLRSVLCVTNKYRPIPRVLHTVTFAEPQQ